MLGAMMSPLQTPEDTFFNGKLYVSNQDDAFSTVLVTHLADGTTGADPPQMRERPGFATRTRASRSPCNSFRRRRLADTVVRPGYYYQNYFKVVDRDGEKQVDAHDGPYVCDGARCPTGMARGDEDGVPVNDVDVKTPDISIHHGRISTSTFFATIADETSRWRGSTRATATG